MSQTRLFHRACKSRKKRAIRTFPQPRRRRVFGYISNVSTVGPKVTFLNGLTRGKQRRLLRRRAERRGVPAICPLMDSERAEKERSFLPDCLLLFCAIPVLSAVLCRHPPASRGPDTSVLAGSERRAGSDQA